MKHLEWLIPNIQKLGKIICIIKKNIIKLKKSFFKVLERIQIDSPLHLVNKRYFSNVYAFNTPQLSTCQNLCFFPDFTNAARNVIDVYSCRDDSFFTDKSKISPEDESFICSLQISRECADSYIRIATTQKNDSVVAIVGKMAIHVFQIDQARGSMDKILQPQYTYKLTNKIYDYIMDISLNVDQIGESWVSFVSKDFYFVQFMKLEELIEEQMRVQAQLRASQSNIIKSNAVNNSSFIESMEEVRV